MERLKNILLVILVLAVAYLLYADVLITGYNQGYDDAIAEENIYDCELIT
jgi:hypothetical protein